METLSLATSTNRDDCHRQRVRKSWGAVPSALTPFFRLSVPIVCPTRPRLLKGADHRAKGGWLRPRDSHVPSLNHWGRIHKQHPIGSLPSIHRWQRTSKRVIRSVKTHKTGGATRYPRNSNSRDPCRANSAGSGAKILAGVRTFPRPVMIARHTHHARVGCESARFWPLASHSKTPWLS